MQSELTTCHVCGAQAARAVPALERLHGVTSDCRLWPTGTRLAACSACGCVQKVLDARWQADASQIYGGYTIYYQSGGVEQPVFDPAGTAAPRSERLLERIVATGRLPERGRLLDVGCGNGALLRSAAQSLPAWTLVGTELDDKYRDVVERIPHVEQLHVGPPSTAAGVFDAITMLHVLEHLPAPAEFMRALCGKLAPDGLVVIQLPEFVQNPFDLLIADHCTHFTLETLSAFLVDIGFEILEAHQAWVPKELTLLARPGRGKSNHPPLRDTYGAASASVTWLNSVLEAARSAARQQPFGLFGTSIAATWLAGELQDDVAFFVDEDPARIGRQHFGKPIHAPSAMPADASLLVALPGPLGESVAERLRGLRPDVHPHTLPPLPPMPPA